MVENVYKHHLWASRSVIAVFVIVVQIRVFRFSPAKTQALEFSQYLENYLWPNFSPEQVSVNLSPWKLFEVFVLV